MNSAAYNNRNLFSYNAEDQKSEMSLTQLKSRCWQALLFVEAPGKIVPCFFQLLEAPVIPWLVTASLQCLLLESWISLAPLR